VNELFGHTRGAFTNSATTQSGLIHEAEGGTLFLDEVDSLSALAQVKLLRFLQEKEYRPLGSTKICQADVRIIAATNRDLATVAQEGRLRQDLYYRLNIVSLWLPPLRQRREDIPHKRQDKYDSPVRPHGYAARGSSSCSLCLRR
jgi:transcriptional regulator with PAS, ATPase and Fis domain